MKELLYVGIVATSFFVNGIIVYENLIAKDEIKVTVKVKPGKMKPVEEKPVKPVPGF